MIIFSFAGILILGLSCSGEKATAPEESLDESLYASLRVMIEAALHEICRASAFGIETSLEIDTTAIPALHWPVAIPETTPATYESIGGWLYATSHAEGDNLSTDVQWFYVRKDSSGSPVPLDAHDLSWEVLSNTKYIVTVGPDSLAQWRVDLEVQLKRETHDHWLLDASVFARERSNDRCPIRDCNRYSLRLQAPLEDFGIPLSIRDTARVTAAFAETETSGQGESGVLISWEVDGIVLSSGLIELETISGSFSVTDTLPLCP